MIIGGGIHRLRNIVAAKDELAIVCRMEGRFTRTVVRNHKNVVYVEGFGPFGSV